MKGKYWRVGMKTHIGAYANVDDIRHWSYAQASPNRPTQTL
jgi:hypothetical protein